MPVLIFQYKETKLPSPYPFLWGRYSYPRMKFTLPTKTQSCLNCHLVQGRGWHTGQLATRAAQPMSQKCPMPQRHDRQCWVHRDGGSSLFWEYSGKVLGQATYLPQLERLIQAGGDLSIAHEPRVDQESVWVATEDSFKTVATAGMAREPARHALCRCGACPSISSCNLVQNSKALLVQEDAGLPLTHLRNGSRGKLLPGTGTRSFAITLACALLTLLASSIFCLVHSLISWELSCFSTTKVSRL